MSLVKTEKIKNFRDLEIWKLGKTIALDIYRATKAFPEAERFGFVAQMRRASISIPSNISEGFNRFHNREYKQFLFIALGSCAELETQLELSHELGFLNAELLGKLLDQLDHESRMIRNLIKRL